MKRNNKNYLLLTFLLVLLLIGIGYAYLTSNLSITGATSVSSNTWDIHFANLSINENSVAATTPASIDGNNTSISYAITLDKPGDFYEFTVDIVNTGTLPGIIDLASISGIPTNYENIIEYSIKYENGNPVSIGDILNSNSSKQIVVKTSYKKDISNSELITSNLDLNLTLNMTYVQSDEEDEILSPFLQQLISENSSCFTKYEGQVTDQIGVTKEAENVYFNRCDDKRNIIFNNMCWQMIRTTETGGIKMIYNGDPVDGKCESTRGNHKGIVQSNYTDQTLSSSYLYGSSFTYDISTNEFTLIDTTTATWGDSTYENLIGKYTCKTNNNTCTTIYNINGYKSNTEAYASAYTIANTNYAQIGTSSFNANYRSPAMVGYMFNKVYKFSGSSPNNNSLMGNDVSYSNGTYTLLPANGESSLSTVNDATHHYSCQNTTGTCNKVSFYYYESIYIELDGEVNIEEAINNMLYNDNVNRYNSSIKGIIDAWYNQNLSGKTNMLEDTVYCNARNMLNQSTNGWNKDGNKNTYIYFKNNTPTNDLSCINITDQFAVRNNKAKLTYPISLINHEELYNMGSDSLRKTGAIYRGLSPFYFSDAYASMRYINSSGGLNNDGYKDVQNSLGVRPTVTLGSNSVISSGTGSVTAPWIVQE